MNRLMMTLLVLFSMLCIAALANDMPVAEQVTKTSEQDTDAKPGQPDKTDDDGDSNEDSFTKENFQQKFLDKLKRETYRLQIRMSLPEELYEQQGMKEVHISSERWDYTEGRVINGFEDSFKDATIKAWWHSRPGKAIKQRGENTKLRLRLFVEQEKESDFDSPNRTRFGFMFGSLESRLPDFGLELSDQPEVRVEFYQHGKATEMKIDSNGDAVEEPVLIRHRFSYKAGLFDDTSGRFRYEADNIRGWFGLTLEHDLEDQTTRFFLDDLKVGDSMYLASGISYYGRDDKFGFYDNRMKAPEGSVVLTLSLYGTFGSITDIPKAFNPANWANPFKKEQRSLKLLAQRQRHNTTQLAAANN